MKTIKLYLIALVLITVVNLVNRILVKRKNGNLEGYDYQEAYALDVFACKNYRTFWNTYLTDGSEKAYKFGADGESISSTLGENILRNTQSKSGRKGKIASWFYGDRLSKILDKAFKEPTHCVTAREAYLASLAVNKS